VSAASSNTTALPAVSDGSSPSDATLVDRVKPGPGWVVFQGDVGGVDTTTKADVPTRRYDDGMTEIAAPVRKPLSGPTGQRVAARRGELLEVLRRHGVTNPEIFGSAARGDDREGSDLDLLVDFPVGTDIVDIIGIKRELEDVLGVPVDLVPRSGLKERVRSRAAKDLLPL